MPDPSPGSIGRPCCVVMDLQLRGVAVFAGYELPLEVGSHQASIGLTDIFVPEFHITDEAEILHMAGEMLQGFALLEGQEYLSPDWALVTLVKRDLAGTIEAAIGVYVRYVEEVSDWRIHSFSAESESPAIVQLAAQEFLRSGAEN